MVSTTEILIDKSFDADLNFLIVTLIIVTLTPYISQEEHKNLNENGAAATFPILRLNIVALHFQILNHCMSYLIIKAFIKLEIMEKEVGFQYPISELA